MASPDPLYKIVIRSIAEGPSCHYPALFGSRSSLDPKPGLISVEMQFDICQELYREGVTSGCAYALDRLDKCLSAINTFLDFLQLGHKRIDLHKMFELINGKIISSRTAIPDADIIDFGLPPTTTTQPWNYHGIKQLSDKLSEAFAVKLSSGSIPVNCVNIGLNLASFLMDSGWYVAATKVLSALEDCFKGTLSPLARNEIHTKQLHALSEYRQFDLGGEVLKKLSVFTGNQMANSSSELCEISNYFYWRSLFPDSHEFGMRAIKSVSHTTPSRVAIDVLRQAGKANVVRRQFYLAHLLLGEALLYAQEIFGKHHLRYADCLMDFGFYLLNVDEVGKSVQAYQEALSIRESILGHHNLLVAKAYEELAYATYVHEYSSGHFEKAKKHAEASLQIMHNIIPSNHLLVASSQRVLALILEEIAIDELAQPVDKIASKGMLAHAEKLHLSAVSLSTKAFGEKNVQTAKHYGNLGRLYQTMERFSEAEKMHLKAIQIKEALLGRDDYEVALSIGHLASLYNYDLDEFNKAEELYLRSVSIALRLFGPAYSGLEYDYRGLIRIYEETADFENVYKYINMLRDWKELKNARETESCDNVGANRTARPITQILKEIDQHPEIQKGIEKTVTDLAATLAAGGPAATIPVPSSHNLSSHRVNST